MPLGLLAGPRSRPQKGPDHPGRSDRHPIHAPVHPFEYDLSGVTKASPHGRAHHGRHVMADASCAAQPAARVARDARDARDARLKVPGDPR